MEIPKTQNWPQSESDFWMDFCNACSFSEEKVNSTKNAIHFFDVDHRRPRGTTKYVYNRKKKTKF